MDDFRIKPGDLHLFAAVCRGIDGTFLVDLPIQNVVFYSYVSLPDGTQRK